MSATTVWTDSDQRYRQYELSAAITVGFEIQNMSFKFLIIVVVIVVVTYV